MQTARVLVVSHIRLYREGLAFCLSHRTGLSLFEASGTPQEAISRIDLVRPDVVLIDMAMPGALLIIQAIPRSAPDVKVIALGVAERDVDIVVCAEAGVGGFVMRESSVDDLTTTILGVLRDELPCPGPVATALVRQLRARGTQLGPATRGRLTAREKEIVALIDHGFSNREISEQLRIELATVKNHVHNILEKLHVRRRGEAAARLRLGASPSFEGTSSESSGR